jgi:hypothetical protein
MMEIELETLNGVRGGVCTVETPSHPAEGETDAQFQLRLRSAAALKAVCDSLIAPSPTPPASDRGQGAPPRLQ